MTLRAASLSGDNLDRCGIVQLLHYIYIYELASKLPSCTLYGGVSSRIVFALLLEKRYGTSKKTIPLQQVGIGCKQQCLVSLCVLLEHVFICLVETCN